MSFKIFFLGGGGNVLDKFCTVFSKKKLELTEKNIFLENILKIVPKNLEIK